MSNRDRFAALEEKTKERNDKYDYVCISTQSAGARIYDSKPSRIKNCLVVIEQGNTTERWLIKNGAPIEIPRSLTICIRGTKRVGVCIGDRDREDSYEFFDKSDEQSRRQLTVTAVVEIEDYSVAFCVDWNKHKSYYLQAWEDEGESDLYVIMEKMHDIKEKRNEQDNKEIAWEY
jgi:hypothetical protein